MDRKIEHKTFLRRRHIPIILGAIVVLLALAWVAFGNHQATLNVDKQLLTISRVELGEFKDYVRLSGTVAPIEVVQISAVEGGVVTEKCVEEGARVKKGDVIVRLDNANLDLQILNAEAELAEKQNLLRNTQVAMQQDRLNNEMELASLDMDVQRKRRNYEQQERLYKEKLIAREEFLKAQEDFRLSERKQSLITRRLQQDSIYRSVQMDQMEDNLAAMRQNVLLVRERKGKLTVRSTIDGELGLLDVKLGQSIGPGALIGQVNDLSAFRIEARIDEHYIDRVRQGLLASFVRDGKRYELRVRKVFPEVREGKFRVELTPPQPSPAGEGAGKVSFSDSKENNKKTPKGNNTTPSPAGEGAGKVSFPGSEENDKKASQGNNTTPSPAGEGRGGVSLSADSRGGGSLPGDCWGGVRVGQTFYLDLELGQPTQAVLIPRGTFFQATGGQWVFVLSPDGRRAFRRQIRIGRQNPKYYEVVEGLEPGEQVITSAYEAFKDNEVLQLE